MLPGGRAAGGGSGRGSRAGGPGPARSDAVSRRQPSAPRALEPRTQAHGRREAPEARRRRGPRKAAQRPQTRQVGPLRRLGGGGAWAEVPRTWLTGRARGAPGSPPLTSPGPCASQQDREAPEDPRRRLSDGCQQNWAQSQAAGPARCQGWPGGPPETSQSVPTGRVRLPRESQESWVLQQSQKVGARRQTKT